MRKRNQPKEVAIELRKLLPFVLKYEKLVRKAKQESEARQGHNQCSFALGTVITHLYSVG